MQHRELQFGDWMLTGKTRGWQEAILRDKQSKDDTHEVDRTVSSGRSRDRVDGYAGSRADIFDQRFERHVALMRTRSLSRLRSRIASVALRQGIATLREIALRMRRHPSSLTRLLRNS